MKKLLNLILCGVLVLGITGCGSNKIEEVISYLENNEYNCILEDNEHICTMKKGAKEHKFTIHNEEKDNVKYYYNDGTNNYSIIKNNLVGEGFIVLKDNKTEEEKCIYYVQDLQTVQCVDNNSLINCIYASNYCNDYLSQIKESVSTYTDLYKTNDLELPEIKNK